MTLPMDTTPNKGRSGDGGASSAEEFLLATTPYGLGIYLSPANHASGETGAGHNTPSREWQVPVSQARKTSGQVPISTPD